jgi:hypothetical protein
MQMAAEACGVTSVPYSLEHSDKRPEKDKLDL